MGNGGPIRFKQGLYCRPDRVGGPLAFGPLHQEHRCARLFPDFSRVADGLHYSVGCLWAEILLTLVM